MTERERELENALVEMGSTLEWVQAALAGKPVPDFADSFPLVREAMDLRAERDRMQGHEEALRARLRELAEAAGGEIGKDGWDEETPNRASLLVRVRRLAAEAKGKTSHLDAECARLGRERDAFRERGANLYLVAQELLRTLARSADWRAPLPSPASPAYTLMVGLRCLEDQVRAFEMPVPAELAPVLLYVVQWSHAAEVLGGYRTLAEAQAFCCKRTNEALEWTEHNSHGRMWSAQAGTAHPRGRIEGYPIHIVETRLG